ncbi:hypothetical protein N474_09910 [Pseudoalteromonas luteoviolacea CPMOR-2]|nr:hypothetical protein N474_09910 [Pseudoalteromonas luteoviolacea CPMOR-2]
MAFRNKEGLQQSSQKTHDNVLLKLLLKIPLKQLRWNKIGDSIKKILFY